MGRRKAEARRPAVMEPVLEVGPGRFALWAVAEPESFGFMPLSGALRPAEIGTAVMRIAQCNDTDPEDGDRPPRPADPLAAFLHGLLTMDDLYAAGGLRVTDTASGTVLVPGCCEGLEGWRGWLKLLKDTSPGQPCLGHDPSPMAERLGDTVRLTVDTERDDSPVIELPITELRHLLTGVERDLTGFVTSAAVWATRHLPSHHSAPVASALARALDMPSPSHKALTEPSH